MTKPEWFVKCEYEHHNTAINADADIRLEFVCLDCGRFEGCFPVKKKQTLVERFRKMVAAGALPIFAEAADEIERLHADLAAMRGSRDAYQLSLKQANARATEVGDLLAAHGFGDAHNVLDRVRSLIAAYEALRKSDDIRFSRNKYP